MTWVIKMRPRHKKNLEARLEAVSDYFITLRSESLNYNDAAKEKHLLDMKELFGNDNPLYLEIGGGKGQEQIIGRINRLINPEPFRTDNVGERYCEQKPQQLADDTCQAQDGNPFDDGF